MEGGTTFRFVTDGIESALEQAREALLGDGARLFDNLGDAKVQLEQVRAVEAPGVTHLKYRAP
jgi:hypothetical protein